MADLVSEIPHDSRVSPAPPPTRLAESPAAGGALQWHPVSGDHHTMLHQPAMEAVHLFARRLFEAQRRWAPKGR